MSLLNQSSPVGKTAFDSIQAKQSAVSAGYERIVVKNERHYKELLSAVTAEFKTKRQTPLVNAGYAARVLAVSHAIHSFIAFHELRNSDRIQIVLLGCGADVIGLWAHNLCPSRVAILEVDTQEVCCSKKDILVRQNIIYDSTKTEKDDSGTVVGRIPCGDDTSQCERNNYFLSPVDLRDIPSVNKVAMKYLDVESPTLVITELVLSYLNQRQTDLLLLWCSSTLLQAPSSCFLALETLSADTSSKRIGPVDGYKRQYNFQFGNKMDRGLSSRAKQGKDSQTFFSIGSSSRVVVARFLEQGFDQAHACTLGKAAASASLPGRFEVPELFDEHAALALYLKSYTLAIGFSSGTEGLMRRLMCPWYFATSEIRPSLQRDLAVTVVEQVDENSVRDLVLDAYQEKMEQYPAVRKMVSHMMKTDLALSEEMDRQSSIGARFCRQGGIFFVAIEYTGAARNVIGCVGVRRWDRNVTSKTMEVVRLTVNSKHRGKGVGRYLLEKAESFARSRGARTLVSTTISILATAKRLYESCGYEQENDLDIGGGLNMLTYTKALHVQAT
eukprot:scaffold1062_cov130-Cylindrotheca_fusiformis.AAC.29